MAKNKTDGKDLITQEPLKPVKAETPWTPFKPDWQVKGKFKIRNNGRPMKFKSPQELLDQAVKYFEECVSPDGELTQPITITGLCNYIGTTRKLLLEYEAGSLEGLKDGAGDDEGFRSAIKHIKGICEQYAETHMFSARNPAGAIFALKNYGWRDIQTIETTTTEVHTLDPELRQLATDYMRQLADSQKGLVIDITPARLPDPAEAQSGGDPAAPAAMAVDNQDNREDNAP